MIIDILFARNNRQWIHLCRINDYISEYLDEGEPMPYDVRDIYVPSTTPYDDDLDAAKAALEKTEKSLITSGAVEIMSDGCADFGEYYRWGLEPLYRRMIKSGN